MRDGITLKKNDAEFEMLPVGEVKNISVQFQDKYEYITNLISKNKYFQAVNYINTMDKTGIPDDNLYYIQGYVYSKLCYKMSHAVTNPNRIDLKYICDKSEDNLTKTIFFSHNNSFKMEAKYQLLTQKLNDLNFENDLDVLESKLKEIEEQLKKFENEFSAMPDLKEKVSTFKRYIFEVSFIRRTFLKAKKYPALMEKLVNGLKKSGIIK